METFAMLCKSYSEDFKYAQRMVETFNEFNIDSVPLFLVVPEADLALFESLVGSNIQVLSETLLSKHLVDHEVHGIRPGYINQEIIKLSFWELGLAENYFCVDSDAEFIRSFGVQDFMFDSKTPYSVLVQDLELAVEPEYYNQHWISRETELRSIAELVGMDSRVILTCHGHTVLSRAVLESFVCDFLEPRGWSYADALEFSPYEFTWYNMWLQKSRAIDIYPREPWIKVFHNKSQHANYLMNQLSVNDLTRSYIGVIINSNYARTFSVDERGDLKTPSFSEYLTYSQLVSTLLKKMRSSVARRF